MKKQTKIVIGITVIILVLLFLTQFNILKEFGLLSLVGNDIIQIKAVYTITDQTNLKPLTIAPTPNRPVKQGEIIFLQASQDINEFCSTLKGKITILSSTKDSYGGTTTPTVFNAGFMTARVEYTIDTKFMNPGIYTIEHNWECDGILLGSDGRLSGSNSPEVHTFTVLEEQDEDEDQCRIASCSIGQQLINPGDSNCYCKNTWIEGDGVCSIGERATSPDCNQSECDDTELLLEGQCFPKSEICEKDGGTKDCDGDEPTPIKFNPILIIGLSLVLGGLFLTWKKRK
jgi:hypothetical protein